MATLLHLRRTGSERRLPSLHRVSRYNFPRTEKPTKQKSNTWLIMNNRGEEKEKEESFIFCHILGGKYICYLKKKKEKKKLCPRRKWRMNTEVSCHRASAQGRSCPKSSVTLWPHCSAAVVLRRSWLKKKTLLVSEQIRTNLLSSFHRSLHETHSNGDGLTLTAYLNSVIARRLHQRICN